jgi:hypothetical protein
MSSFSPLVSLDTVLCTSLSNIIPAAPAYIITLGTTFRADLTIRGALPPTAAAAVKPTFSPRFFHACPAETESSVKSAIVS